MAGLSNWIFAALVIGAIALAVWSAGRAVAAFEADTAPDDDDVAWSAGDGDDV